MPSLLDLLEERPGDDTTMAVYSGDREVTRSALRASARDLAATLSAAGVKPGSPIAVMLPNGPEVVAAMFGTWYAGCVYVPINPRVTPQELGALLEATQPAVLIAPAARTDVDRPVVIAKDLSWSAPDRPIGDSPTHEPDIALVQWTSGTTGRPKPVLLRHSGFLKLLEPVLKKLLGAGSDTIAARKAPMPNLIPTSMALSAGIYNVLFAFRVGAAAILMERFDPIAFAGLVDRFQLRSTVLPPASMTMLCDTPEVTSLVPLKYVRSISAPLSPLQARRFRDKFGVTVLNCYGQTEIGGEIVGWNAADAREHGEAKLGSIGRPHEGVTVRIVDADGAEVAEDTAGELYVRTPATAAGYADGAQLGDRLGEDGWFRTGDVARLDPEGFLWIEGRVSDMINRGGLKVFPGDVEEVLRLDPAVADCAVVGAPDERLGEVPWAFIVPADPHGVLDPKALATTARERLAPYKIPTRFIAVTDLPRNEAGKVLHRELLALAPAE
ncbi:MAG: AMP-dependent synthetase and ligase [Mycobacterium sp.]|nr:AMP-dependent synthetase and ligase [Mycobacterium sp.]